MYEIHNEVDIVLEDENGETYPIEDVEVVEEENKNALFSTSTLRFEITFKNEDSS